MATRTSRTTQIYIMVQPATGDLTVSPTSARVDSEGNVQWTLLAFGGVQPAPKGRFHLPVLTPKGEFLLLFDDDAGFGTPELRSVGGKGRLTAQRRGIYHYQVAAAADGQVYADVYCPSIIIR